MDDINNTTNNYSGDLTPEELAMLDEALVQAHEGESNNTIIPSNSPTLLLNETTSRFNSAEWFNTIQKTCVILAGLGGIGSYVAFLLGRLGISRLVLYDDDKVEEANLSGQLFSTNDIGWQKTTAIQKFLRSYAKFYSSLAASDKFTARSQPGSIMIGGFDNMRARKIYYNAWKGYVINNPYKEECLFIDGRLAAEEFQVFCIKGSDTFLMDKYEKKWLFDDNEAEYTLCSYKQTSFCANMIASVIVNLFVNFIANQCNPIIERELPFYTSYDATRMYFKTEMV